MNRGDKSSFPLLCLCGFPPSYFLVDTGQFFVEWQEGIEPEYGESPAFHASEPGHLPLGKLVYGDFEERYHLVISGASDEVFGNVFVFQPVVDERLGVDTLVEQPLYLGHHALVEPVVQPLGDAGTTPFPLDTHPLD